MTGTVFRLAYNHGSEFRASEYGYFAPAAAKNAVITLNLARFIRRKPEYTHIAHYVGNECLAVKPLEGLS